MFTDVIDVADRTGILQAVKGKLVRQPDPAAAKASYRAGGDREDFMRHWM